jgi:hypothetical protein
MTEKTLTAKYLKRESHWDMTVPQYFETLEDETITYSDLFHRQFWRHHMNLRPNSLVRLRHPLGTFDVILNIVHKVAGGLQVEFFAGRPPRGVDPYKIEAEAREADMKLTVAPIAADGKPICKVQYTAKTKWRVLGLGGSEIQRDIGTQREAEAILVNYLTSLNMRNPTDDELLAHATKKAAALAAAQKEPVTT